jgi:Zn-dependent peptidase ImmA (M78 family)
MRGRRLRHIEDLAQKILNDAGILDIPIKPEDVASLHQINVIYHRLGEDVSGVLVLKEGKVTIGCNRNQSKVRQRFTIAHELGHFFLAHQRDGLFVDTYENDLKIYRNNESSTGEVIQEREANAFAAALLMPSHLIVKKITDLNVDPKSNDDLSSLAKQFGVSTQAMTYRVMNIFGPR